MEWQTPADEHWHKNYTVTYHANCNDSNARYTATHLPTGHQESARARVSAIEKLSTWVAKQDAPMRPMPAGSVTSIEERRAMMQRKAREHLLNTKRG